MPKPERTRHNLQEWASAEGHGEVVAFTRCINTAPVNPGTTLSGSVSITDADRVAGLLGRDLADNSLVQGSAHAFTLTRSSLFVLRLSGWKEKVDHAVCEFDADAVVVHHHDAANWRGDVVRYLVADGPDGRWVLDSMITVKKNGARGPYADTADHFLTTLGPRARELTTP